MLQFRLSIIGYNVIFCVVAEVAMRDVDHGGEEGGEEGKERKGEEDKMKNDGMRKVGRWTVHLMMVSAQWIRLPMNTLYNVTHPANCIP
jgi:hypothetical protein